MVGIVMAINALAMPSDSICTTINRKIIQKRTKCHNAKTSNASRTQVMHAAKRATYPLQKVYPGELNHAPPPVFENCGTLGITGYVMVQGS